MLSNPLGISLRGFSEVQRQLASSASIGVLSGNSPLAEDIALFMVQVVIILSICRALGIVGTYLKQPKVIFEIIGGILLGPSAIGRNSHYMSTIFPKASLPLLGIVANMGLVLYLFVVGMELDPQLLMTHARRAGGIAFMGMAAPFALGVAISGTMFDVLQRSDPKYENVSATSFFVFIGTALSITAFPVLARILKEGGLIYTVPGSMAMGAAALNDAAAWCLLILAISIANAGNMGIAGLVFLCVVAFALGLFFLVRPVWWRLISYVENMHNPALNNSLFCLTLILMFLCAWTTDLLGVHSIFGAFLFGLIMPRDSHLFKECNDKIEELILTLTLPLYFALSGLQTDVTQINTGEQGAMVILVVAMATAGKFLGVGGLALLSGMTFRESSVIAVLMNTRGLVELIVLNLGMQSGILSVRTFSVMVIMCLVTTFMTCPIVECIYPPRLRPNAATGAHEEDASLLCPEAPEKAESDGAVEHIAPTPAVVENLLRDARITVIVDRMEHLQGTMELLSALVPYMPGSETSITAVRAHEPSLTEKDEFIGLDAEGRLIEVEQESTVLIETHATGPGAVMSRMMKQELLPLAMFLQAMGATVKALRMRGDPNEFPREVRSIAARSNSNLVFFPWRASPYVERFFWGTVRLSPVPVALVVQVKTVLSTTTTDIATASSPGVGIMERMRSESMSRDEIPPYTRARTGSRAGSKEDPTIPFTPPPGPGPMANASCPTEDLDSVHPSMGMGSRIIRTAIAIVTGAPTDVMALALVLRISERPVVTAITVVVPSDRRSFPDSVRQAFDDFREAADGIRSISLEFLTSPSDDIEAMKRHLLSSDMKYDLAIIGFKSVLGAEVAASAADEEKEATARRLNRSSSLWMVSEPDSVALRRMAGVPEALVSSKLSYPELGHLGGMIRDLELTTYLIVVHETQGQRPRTRTLGGGLLTPLAVDAQFTSVSSEGNLAAVAGSVPNSATSASASASASAGTPAVRRLFSPKDAELYPIDEGREVDQDSSVGRLSTDNLACLSKADESKKDSDGSEGRAVIDDSGVEDDTDVGSGIVLEGTDDIQIDIESSSVPVDTSAEK